MTLSEPTLITTPSRSGWQSLIASKVFLLLIIPALWALSYLPNLGTHDLIHEEGRRATPARAMLVTGDYIVPTLYGDTYFNKPPGFFWVVAGFGTLFRHVDAWTCRLPSALSLLLGVFIIWGFAPRQLRPQTRVLAGLMLIASSIMMFDKARLGEIDALLSALVFWSMSVWYDGYEPQGQALESWLWLGAFMAMAVLLKAPAGPVEFYVPIVAFLLWEKQWKRLFSWGHLLAIIIMILPTAAWVALAYFNSHWTLPEFAHLWWDQIGGDTVPGQSSAALPIKRYLSFPFEIFAMLLPWVLFTIPMMIPPVARWLKVERTLWRFLVCCVGVMTLAFWIWPSSRPRHMMTVIYPACILAAMFVTESSREQIVNLGARLMAAGAKIAAAALAVIGIAGIIIATHPKFLRYHDAVSKTAIGWSIVSCVICLIAAIIMWRITARTPLQYSAISLTCTLAITMLLTFFVFDVAATPYLAKISETRRGWSALAAAIDPNKKLYTTLTLAPAPLAPPSQTAGRGDDFYNIQFYLHPRPQRFPGFAALIKHLAAGESCTLLLLEGEAQQFTAAGFTVHTVAKVPLRKTIEIDEVSNP